MNKNSRLHSFFSDVMEDREDTLIFPPCSASTGLACFRKRLYSSVCRGVSLQETALGQSSSLLFFNNIVFSAYWKEKLHFNSLKILKKSSVSWN